MTQPFTSFADFKRRYPIRPNEPGALLGSGSYGRVIKVEDQVETDWVAIKISEFKGNDSKSLKAEVELAQRVPRQANIARYDACYRFETDTGTSDFAIMKYYPDGNLADLLRRQKLTPAQINDLTRGILLGLQHLHGHRIVHRDFKPANILVSRDNAGRLVPKIADFGLSKLVSDDELDSSDFDLSDGRGTPSYKAPEQIEGSRVSFNLDLWAFGVILYEMLTGEKPFRSDLPNASEQSVRRAIEKKIMSVELPTALASIPDPYGLIIRRCLVRDIRQRARKESELLDLLDGIPQLMTQGLQLLGQRQYEQAVTLFEQVLTKRDAHPEAEKGLLQCRQAIAQHQIAALLVQADTLLTQQQFEQAKETYEAVLRIDPLHKKAIDGLTMCISRLQSVQQAKAEAEPTDLYEEEKTDLYEPRPSPRPVRTVVTAAPTPAFTRTAASAPLPTTPKLVGSLMNRSYPWRVIIPVALGIGGLVFYVNQPTREDTRKVTQQASVTLSVPGEELKDSSFPTTEEKETNPAALPAANAEAEKTRRVDVALRKAQLMYLNKDYAGAIEMSNSALGLAPGRRDVIALRTAAQKAQQAVANGEAPAPVFPTVTAQPVEKNDVARNEPASTAAPAPSPEEEKKKLLTSRQAEYNQLIEEGQAAIQNGNNKAKAIAKFTEARSKAKGYDLSLHETTNAYNYCIGKANRVFDSENFDQALKWYEVAQALNDSPEVQARIKKCKANLD